MLILINAAEYAGLTNRLDAVEQELVWLEAKGRDAATRIIELVSERAELTGRMLRIEPLNAYDELLD